MERDPSLCCSSIVKGQSYSYAQLADGGICYSCLTARDEFLYCYTNAKCHGYVVVSSLFINLQYSARTSTTDSSCMWYCCIFINLPLHVGSRRGQGQYCHVLLSNQGAIIQAPDNRKVS